MGDGWSREQSARSGATSTSGVEPWASEIVSHPLISSTFIAMGTIGTEA